MPAPAELHQLIERFKRNHDEYRRGTFNETQLRVDYLNPLFELLGWDMTNRAGAAEKYRDVIHEAQVKVGGVTKAPDYCFKIGPERKFFLEAKKPAVNVKEDIAPAFQLRRYAWSANLPLSILSDFEEFAVYDCRIKPDRLDRASVARIMYFSFEELVEKWEEFAGIFSRESVLQGSLDRFAESSKTKRGTAQVDNAFLSEIESWREMLAKDIAKRNTDLTQGELNDAVQRTIDRIIFLRIAEDRGIEEYGRLLALRNGANVYPRLVQLFHQADQRYNSGLFHFRHEKGEAETPDELTPGLTIDDKLLQEIFRRLYYPDSPYEFSVFPASILGQVYEQFLGKVITLDKRHRAAVEEKPEVRKAGGVYYTPEYIARYIVENTVGKLVEGKTPKEVAKLRVLDPACGSGSFLLVAYSFLLDWHLTWYSANEPEKLAKGKNAPIYQGPAQSVAGDLFTPSTANWRLTTEEKKRILLNNFYGVDIDRQAVEVTKLSLLLKMLEGENEQTLGRQMALLHERVLPDLGNNIKCGNSLIGSDFYDEPANADLHLETRLRINAFDWEEEFKAIMKGGGFDAVIGNPPYIRIQAMKEWAPLEVEFYKEKYAAASKGNYDIYVVFVEKALSLLNKNGLLGFILPHKFFNAQYGESLRRIIANGQHLSKVVHFGDQQVFAGATTYTCLLFLSKQKSDTVVVDKVSDLDAWRMLGESEAGTIHNEKINASEWNLSIGTGGDLFARLSSLPTKLGDLADIFVGLQTSADDVFILDFQAHKGNHLHLNSKALNSTVVLESGLLHPIVSGTDVKRYSPLPARQFILFPYHVQDERATLMNFETIYSKYPLSANYLNQNRARLSARERGKFNDEKWFRFGRSQNLGIQNRPKLCIPRLVTHLYAAFDKEGALFLDNVDVGGVTLKSEYCNLGLGYILALLNSRLLRWYFPKVSAPFRGGWYSANRQFLSQLPVPVLDLEADSELKLHNAVVSLSSQILELYAQHTVAKTAHDKAFIQRQIDQTDRKIDRLVYELYELTPEEIAIVEGSATEAEA